MLAEGNVSVSNPNVCPACVRLINTLDEATVLKEVPAEIPTEEPVEQIVPQSASLYGGTFVW
jgi:hypothetical protein